MVIICFHGCIVFHYMHIFKYLYSTLEYYYQYCVSSFYIANSAVYEHTCTSLLVFMDKSFSRVYIWEWNCWCFSRVGESSNLLDNATLFSKVLIALCAHQPLILSFSGNKMADLLDENWDLICSRVFGGFFIMELSIFSYVNGSVLFPHLWNAVRVFAFFLFGCLSFS